MSIVKVLFFRPFYLLGGMEQEEEGGGDHHDLTEDEAGQVLYGQGDNK